MPVYHYSNSYRRSGRYHISWSGSGATPNTLMNLPPELLARLGISNIPTHSNNSSSRRREWRYTVDENETVLPIPNPDWNRAPDPVEEQTLTVKRVDLKIEANGNAHHTSEYEMSSASKSRPKLVARRGQPFEMDVHFNRPYDPAADDLRISFAAGPSPMKSKGTHVEMLLSDEDPELSWGAKVLNNEGSTLTVTIFTPPSLYVGKWNLNLEVVEKDDTSQTVYSYQHPDPIYFLFNPWCKDDSVYLETEDQLQEYVLNEFGMIYNGSSKQITYKPWNFGQFEDNVLDVAMTLMDNGGLKWPVRGNPVPVIRKLTAMVNSQDDNGILIGNWSGDYSGGVSPLQWTGSAAILNRYWERKQPVSYAQCWVYSGVLTTLMRALGIPARSVTNFLSAHDTDGSITIDYHYGPDGEPEDHKNHDSIWNFHVWNEVWIARPDLPTGYGGWQAVDSTPQETSDGIYVCGPTPIEAIKQGEVNLPYDAPFLFAEVNADCCFWLQDENGGYKPVRFSKERVGKFISTKACNSNQKEDITHTYKANEDTAEERSAVMRANQVASTRKGLYVQNQEDVFFSVEQDAENTWVGGDFVVRLSMTNNSSEQRTVSGKLVVKTMFYTGVTADKVKGEPLALTPLEIPPGSGHVFEARVTPDEYLDKLKDCCMLDVSFMAQVLETNQVFTSKDDFRLRKPHLTFQAPTTVQAGSEFLLYMSFINPLNRTLTRCQLDVDGLTRHTLFPVPNVGANGTFSVSVPITASKRGQKEIIANFNSKELEDVNGSHSVFIESA